MQRFFAEIRKADGGLSCYGEEEVRLALSMGAVDMLLLSDSLKRRRITIECGKGHTHEMTVPSADEKFTCPECGQSANVVSDEDLIDDFFNKADAFNTRLQLISGDSEEGDMLLKAFGGIAAMLRYRPN